MNLLLQAIYYFCTILQYLIFIEVILSWIPSANRSSFSVLIRSTTRPILNPIRKMIYNSPLGGAGMMLDFSPVFAGFILELIKNMVR